MSATLSPQEAEAALASVMKFERLERQHALEHVNRQADDPQRDIEARLHSARILATIEPGHYGTDRVRRLEAEKAKLDDQPRVDAEARLQGLMRKELMDRSQAVEHLRARAEDPARPLGERVGTYAQGDRVLNMGLNLLAWEPGV
jgi:hypothetical protein